MNMQICLTTFGLYFLYENKGSRSKFFSLNKKSIQVFEKQNKKIQKRNDYAYCTRKCNGKH